MEEMISIINNVGFPIAACMFMAYQNQKLTTAIAGLQATMGKIDERLSKIEDFELKKER